MAQMVYREAGVTLSDSVVSTATFAPGITPERMRMSLKALVFDLDGTLLDTLPDLVALTNAVMDAHGYPRHTAEEILTYIGSGARVLMRRAIPSYVPDDDLDGLMQLWRDLYPEFGFRLTKPYPGIAEALSALHREGVLVGVLSNKFDAAVQDVIEAFFPGAFDIVRGEGPDTPRKPDPAGLLDVAREWGLPPAQIGLVGDTGGTDIAAACAAGAFPIGVSWGDNSAESLWAAGARAVIDDPAELLALCR